MAWRLGRRILGSQYLDGPHVRLWFPSELDGRLDASEQLEQWGQAVRAVSTKLGCEPRVLVNVLLFPTIAETQRTFGRRVHGETNIRAHAVIVSADSLEASGHPQETMRHEVAHLLSSYWGKLAPPLKCEGLAVWAQGTTDGREVDFFALTYLLAESFPPISRLLEPSSWRADFERSYAIAGSLTGYLIAAYGWDTYKSFFAGAGIENFEDVFGRIFGGGLIAVQRQWVAALMGRRHEFEPELSRAVLERRVRAAYDDWRLYECIDLGDVESSSSRALLNVARAKKILGDYAGAVESLKRATAREERWDQEQRASLYVELGKCCDLAGQREAAVAAYEKALDTVCEQPADSATSSQARRYANKPYSEREWLEEMKSWEKT